MIKTVLKALVVLGVANLAQARESYGKRHLIQLKNQIIDTSSPEKRAENWPGDLVLPEKVQILVHFDDFLMSSVEEVKNACQAETHSYIPEDTAVVTCLSSEINKVKSLAHVDYVGPFAGDFKILENWRSVSISRTKEGKLKFKILIAPGFSESPEETERLVKSLEEIKGFEIISTYSKYATVAVPEEMSVVLVNLVSTEEYCTWVQPVSTVSRNNQDGRWITQSGVEDVFSINNMGIDGSGITVGVTDSGIDLKHCFFYDQNNPTITFCGKSQRASAPHCNSPGNHRKVVGYYGIADTVEDSDTHGTHVAGTLAGNPVITTSLGSHLGIAYNAKLAIVDIFSESGGSGFDLDGDVFPFLRGMKANISSNSWGYQTPINTYNSDSFEVDNFAAANPNFLILFAAGNDGPNSETIDPYINSKNGLAIGSTVKLPTVSISSFSSRGPTKEGRIKPDIVTPGSSITSSRFTTVTSGCGSQLAVLSGTSMATPNAAGAAALVYQYYRDGHLCGKQSSCQLNPSASLVKATLINSGQHFSGGSSFSGSGAFHIGFGRVKLDDTLAFGTGTLQVFDNIPIRLNQAFVQKVIAKTGSSIKVTLVWTDPASTSSSTAQRALINDLDLRVITPSGKIESGNKYLGIYNNEADGLNNVEQILIPSSETELGEYKVEVVAYSFGVGDSQNFALVINNGSSTVCTNCQPVCKGKYSCGGSNPTCIEYTQVCDTVNDCPNSSDEDTKVCNLLKKTLTDCRNGIHINVGKNCDGVEDCEDGGDERECSSAAILVPVITFITLFSLLFI